MAIQRHFAMRRVGAAIIALALLGAPAGALDSDTAVEAAHKMDTQAIALLADNASQGGAGGESADQAGARAAALYESIMDDVDEVIAVPVGRPQEKSRPDDKANAKIARPQAIGPTTPAPVVVELFTAQGCAACPPAEDLLAALRGRPDVLGLAWHVDYWDYLGWTDKFARPEFVERQRAYGKATGARTLFTPQMIVDGTPVAGDLNPASMTSAIRAATEATPEITIRHQLGGPRQQLELISHSGSSDMTVNLVRYLPDRTLKVTAGENRGRKLRMYNVVASIEELARWNGAAPLRLTLTPGSGETTAEPDDMRHAVIVQSLVDGEPGQVRAALRLD